MDIELLILTLKYIDNHFLIPWLKGDFIDLKECEDEHVLVDAMIKKLEEEGEV